VDDERGADNVWQQVLADVAVVVVLQAVVRVHPLLPEDGEIVLKQLPVIETINF
jgi:hypothetical protein